MDKNYRAERPADDEIGDCRVFVIDPETGKDAPLRHVVHHSPTGFEWGYSGSGPADLALSILADYYGEKPTKSQIYRGGCKCWGPHQRFKSVFIAPQPKSGFEIDTGTIRRWLSANGYPTE